MKIIIAGCGEVGSHLAKLLSREEQDITVIDEDSAKLAVLDSNYNLLTVQGRPTSFKTLRQAGVEGCELFIAVTPFETRNIVSCAIARSLGAEKTVARVDNFEFKDPANLSFFTSIGTDDLIYPEYLAALEIINALNHNWARHWFELHEGQLILVGVKLRDNAPLIGKYLKDLGRTIHDFHVAAIKRNHETIIPGGDDRLLANDIVYFMTTREHVDALIPLCGKVQRRIRDVIIMGGSRIAIQLCSLAGDKFNFKILDPDRELCMKLSERCPDALIINADARDTDALRDAGISDTDAFIAISDSSESNILTCLTAKEFGVKKTIAEVENLQFISEAEGLNIGTVVNKKLLASSRIFQMLLDRDTSTSKCLALADAEVAEIVAKEGSKITRAPIKDLHLSSYMTIAGLIRDGEGHLVGGNTVIKPGDRVVVFTLDGVIHKVEKLFS
ncbi:Trk system potassium transporter TrkA [uncultured Duncaniella sp.]|jgi:trk system potassium uptake protein TrkA|uniref:Trk system potassium transporter TrkA n=1 Tax=uncultured Duncaniella sp. TaxID=2768039 RepID=UPI002675CF01|nr:Trk system potassium transporter TrkA [uncultured Duncaniella sp.]MCI9172571.1 Trk system potassium transporter TrkA [Muribaculaceae bacterium]